MRCRRFLRDAILHAAEMIRDKEIAAGPQPGTVSSTVPTFDSSPVPGAPALACRFCRIREPLFQVVVDGSSDFVCDDHLGPFVADWMTATEVTVVRL